MVLVNSALSGVGIWWISGITISSTGLALYGVNKLSWSDVAEARFYTLFGLRCIRVKRIKGMSWSLPLYFVGPEKVEEALLRNAPEGNPLNEVAHRLKSASSE